MVTPLVICVGNIARGDDGVAHAVAQELRDLAERDSAHVIVAVDLDVAMAHDVSRTPLVVLVDAERRDEPPVRVERVTAAGTTRPTGHGIDAPSLLAIAGALYGSTPVMWLVSVAAPDMGHATHLSHTARAASIEAARAVGDLIELWRSKR